jgi:hypothetical protein
LFSSITTETVGPNTTNYGAGAGVVEVRTTNPSTGLPSDTILGSGNYVDAQMGGGIVIFPVGGWHGATFISPVVLSNAVPYWITFRLGPPFDTTVPPNGSSFLAIDISPSPEPTPYTTQAVSGGAWQPAQTDQFFKIRVLSNDCTAPTPTGSVTTIGSGCGSATLTTTGSPALGSPSFGIQIHSSSNAPAALFLGTLGRTGGTQLAGSCMLHLDVTSVIGTTPILAGTTNSSGTIGITASVPMDTNLAGLQFAFQAAALVPNGPVSIGQQGAGLVVTQALLVTIGY